MNQQFTAQKPDSDKDFHSYVIFAGKHVYQITAQSFDEASAVGYNKAQQDKDTDKR